MSLGRRYDVNRYNSVLLREDTPGRYRKLSDDEIALEWERSRMRANGNMRRTVNDGSTTVTPQSESAREATVRPSQSLNVGKKKDKGGKRQKSKSLTGKEDKLLREIPVRQESVTEDLALREDASFTNPDDEGRPVTLDVDFMLAASGDAKEFAPFAESDQTEVKPVLPIITTGEKTEKHKKEKKVSVKDKKKSKSNKATCEVHKNRKHKENKLKKFFESNKKSDDSMNNPRHCRSCTCDLSLDGPRLQLDNTPDSSDTSSLSSSHHEDSTSCRSLKHSDTTSLSSSHHAGSSSPTFSSTPRDKPKHKVSSASDKSSHSSASAAKLKVKPEKPQRSLKSPPSTPEPSGSDTKESPRQQVLYSQTCPVNYAKVPDTELVRLNEYTGGDSEGYASDGRTPGLICLKTDGPILLQDGDSFEVLSGSGFNRDPNVNTGTYVCFDEVKKDEFPNMPPKTGPEQATQTQPGDDREQSDSSVSAVQPLPEMTTSAECGARVAVKGSGIALPIVTVPLENTMAYHSELRPPAGFRECDSPDEKEVVVVTAPLQSLNGVDTDVQPNLDPPNVRLYLTGESEDVITNTESRDPSKKIVEDMNRQLDLTTPCTEIGHEDMKNDAEVDIPEMRTTGIEVDNVPFPSSGSHIKIQNPEPPAVDPEIHTPEGKKIALPTGPYVGIVVVSQDSDSSGTDRPVRKETDRGYNEEPQSGHHTSTSESESSSNTSSSSSGKGKTKAKIEKPKRKGKDKFNKKGEKDTVDCGDILVVQPAESYRPNIGDLQMPPAIRRAEKVEDISKTVHPGGDVTVEPLNVDVQNTALPVGTVSMISKGSKEDEINVSHSDHIRSELKFEERTENVLQDAPVGATDMDVATREDNTDISEVDSPLLRQTINVPIPELDLSVQTSIAEPPEVNNKTPVTSTKEHRVSQSSDSDTSSSSDHRRKKGKYRFGEYSSEDNRDSYLSPLGPLSSHSPLNVSQTLAATSNPSLNGLDKLEASLAHCTPMKVMDGGAMPSIVRHRGHFVVVAIDFGTTFSGYALSFTRDPESVHMMRNWEGGDPGVINQKTPTTILLSPEGEFDSFGFTARDRYHNLTPDEAKQWLYFERFKMVLHHNPDLTRDTMLKASNGQACSALKVFALAIRFFKEHALQQLTDQSGITIVNDDVRWVITVPAIWKAPAKQFMRQAAYEADLVSPDCPDQLLIALEPEAASIYCRKLRMYQLVPEHPEWRPLQSPRYSTPEPLNDHLACSDIRDDVARPPFDLPPDYPLESKIKGTRYMVVDCGGGTVDITVHELGEDTKLKELYKATGGPYGATAVDDEFINMLCDIFGHEFISHYRAKYPIGWLNLMINFESRKRSASPFKNNSLNVSLPFTFIDYFKKQKGGHIDSVVKKYGNKEVCWSSEGMLRLSPHAMRCLFVPVMEKIKNAIGDILNHPNARNLKYLFLVGGFAESSILQHDIRKEFSTILKVLIPTGVSLAILKGAVLFGLDPTIVNIRRSRLTYGVGVLNRFDPSRHPTSKLVHRDGVDWCTDVFDVFVQVDQPVALGDNVIRSYTPAKVNQLISVIHIYSSEDTDAPFITDPGVRKCGTLCLDLSDLEADSLPNRREIQARMMFGDTEIKVSALDVATGRCVRANIDFLNK